VSAAAISLGLGRALHRADYPDVEGSTVTGLTFLSGPAPSMLPKTLTFIINKQYYLHEHQGRRKDGCP